VEAYGLKVSLVEGEEKNIKITTQIDLMMAENILEARSQSFDFAQDESEV
jgi:2-C-methyl-D-erythritol 4-phosphate cytidylyltransferase